MTTALAKYNGSVELGRQIGYTPEFIETVKNNFAKDATDAELQMFLMACHTSKLNPFNKEVYFWKSGGKVCIHTGIAGRRLAAERTGKYAPGPPVKREYDEKGNHISSTAYVYKFIQGQQILVEFTANMSEWKRDTPQWKGSLGSHQLDITAERHALNKAFPQLNAVADEADMSGSIPHTVPAETEEDAAQRSRYSDCLLKIGKLFMNGDQYASLAADVQASPIASLEERHEKAIIKLREYVLTEIGKQRQGEAYSEFIIKAFPGGVDAADCPQLFTVLGLLETQQASPPASDASSSVPPKSSTLPDGEPNEGPLTLEEEAAIAHAEAVEDLHKTLKFVYKDDLVAITKRLEGIELDSMSAETIRQLHEDIKNEAGLGRAF